MYALPEFELDSTLEGYDNTLRTVLKHMKLTFSSGENLAEPDAALRQLRIHALDYLAPGVVLPKQAITAIAAGVLGEIGRGTPVDLRVDRPFLFVIRIMPMGLFLFVGRVTNPRSYA